MPKILVSPGFGAGFATWNSCSKEVAEYKPIIEFIENGGNPRDLEQEAEFDDDDNLIKGSMHPLIEQMVDDIEGLDDYVCTLGCAQLKVVDVNGPYRIEEYDGFESVVTAADFW